MKLNDPRHPWPRLVAAARQARDERDVLAPYGFATRIASLALTAEQRGSLFDRFALRAVGVACVLAIASIAINYSSLDRPAPVQDQANAEDPMSVLLDA